LIYYLAFENWREQRSNCLVYHGHGVALYDTRLAKWRHGI
jgi:hypothetical protein